MFKTEHGTQWFKQPSQFGPSRTDLMLSNTLQPISSDAGGTSNVGGSSIGIANASPNKKGMNQTMSDANQNAVMPTDHSDSALVASYI